jgi:acyl carrier protein
MTVEQIFAEVFSIPETTVQDSLELHQIAAWDSMVHMTLIVRIEEVFKIELTGDEIADVKSVGDVRKALRAHRLAV